MGIKSWLRVAFLPADLCECSGGASETVVTTAMGLLVVVMALWTRAYLSSRLEIFETEMRVATLELANALSSIRVRE